MTASQRKRLTVGYLTGKLYDPYQNLMLHSVMDVARERDANLITVLTAGAWMGRGQAQMRNAIMELLGTENVDGLVIENAWADYSKAVCEMFAPLPMTCATLEIPGIPSVVGEYRQGIRELVKHLVEVHGYRQIAFVHAPLDDVADRDEQARLEGYLDVLADHGIAHNPNLIVRSTSWDLSAARETIHTLFDERKLQPQALVCFNDLLARWTMEALHERGIRVPRDVAVVGYDDIETYRFLTPPLTTVHLPIAEKGRLATEMLFDRLAGHAIPEHVTLPTRLVVRRSCGCSFPGPGLDKETDHPPAQSHTDRATIQAALVELVQTNPNRRIRRAQVTALLDAFFDELNGQATGAFLPTLDEALTATMESESHVRIWQDVISLLHRQIGSALSEHEGMIAENLFDRSRVMIGEAIEQEHVQQKLREQHQLRILSSISEALIASLKTEDLSRILSRWLPLLNIQRCYISRYEDPNAPAEWSQLIAAYDEHGLPPLSEENRRFRSRQLIPQGFFRHAERRHSLVLTPMHFGEEQFGFALFDLGPREGFVYELLGEQLGNMLKGSQLYEGALKAQAAAEKADQLKTRLLANVSHELRTPLNIIMNYAQVALDTFGTQSPELTKQLESIQHSARHQLRVINDLLDLSRAEIDELSLNTELIEPGALLKETFQDLAGNERRSELTWVLDLPERLPLIQADPVRVRQVVLNLLSNANKFTQHGEIVLGADVTPPSLHIWVRDNGVGIPLEQQEHIFEPFVTMAQANQRQGGIGLGLSITRRLVALHRGSMRLESTPGQGSTFHVYLPLPSLSDQPSAMPVSVQPVLLLLSNQGQPAAEINELSQQQGWKIRRVLADENMETLLQEVQPAALAWDLTNSRPGTDHWELVQRLRKYPRLTQLPFILYGYEPAADPALSSGIISVVFGKTLTDAIGNLRPTPGSGPILIVEDDPLIRAQHRLVMEKKLPGYPIREAENGARALEIMLTETPTLVTLDLMMPGIDGFEVLDWMRANHRLRQVPVLILTNRTLTAEDVRRLELHARVNIQSKGILLNDEVAALMQQILADSETLPAYTSALVKRTVAYFQQNYHRPLSRKEVAQTIGMSENYLSQIFRQELGISPWEYLNRYRIKRAKELLSETDDSITSITLQVGFDDPSYFGRVFHKLTGLSPRAYRENKGTIDNNH